MCSRAIHGAQKRAARYLDAPQAMPRNAFYLPPLHEWVGYQPPLFLYRRALPHRRCSGGSGRPRRNLFAVGEVASTGVHGANRLASNSLLEGLVFGHRVARAAAAISPGRAPRKSSKPEISQPKATGKEETACRAVFEPLQQLMWQHAGLTRCEAGLSLASKQLKQWWPLTDYDFAGVALNETRNMLIVAAMMVEAAAARCESRGCHYRHDFPEPDSGWETKHISFQKGDPLPARPGSMNYPEPHF